MEVVPRLLLASRAVTQGEASSTEAESLLDSATVEEFVELILDHDPVMAVAYFEALRARGVSIEAIYLHLLTPSARRLGELWCEDLCDFTKVTLALGRLQQLLRELSPDFRCETESRQHGRRALLMPAPGEQHTFGLFMVAEFFRQAGWDVWSGLPGAGDDVISLVRAEWFDIVGLSVGSESRVDGLAATIRRPALRRKPGARRRGRRRCNRARWASGGAAGRQHRISTGCTEAVLKATSFHARVPGRDRLGDSTRSS
jgi:methanogenic corrinoid protein MtbC1